MKYEIRFRMRGNRDEVLRSLKEFQREFEKGNDDDFNDWANDDTPIYCTDLAQGEIIPFEDEN